ncbi:MAG: TlpA family protein disulfide reductase [Gemmatimonadetes bacterium]|nr:TlpA family protein disulfide reductase [Gemmatimonadota bacterium]
MSHSRVRAGIRVAAVIAAAGLALFALRGQGGYGPVDTGARVPSYGAPSLDGDTVTLESLRGRVVLLNVWATWCKPCVREMPALQRLHEALDDEGLSVVAVSVDNAALMLGDTQGDVRAFIDQHGITFTVLLDPGSRIESTFRVTGLPMTFVIDREGVLRDRILGPREWDTPESLSGMRELLGN